MTNIPSGQEKKAPIVDPTRILIVDPTKALIVDSHEDLAWNMMAFGRDYTLSAAETRQREKGTEIPSWDGDSLLGWPDYQRGRVAVIFSTLFNLPTRLRSGPWETPTYATPEEAHHNYWTQLESYHRLTDQHPDRFRLILGQKDLQDVLQDWSDEGKEAHQVGLVVLMEGAEGVRQPDELEAWWKSGLRIIGPAWAGTRFCGGTNEPGPLTSEGMVLLEAMADYGFALDLSHMDVQAALQALDRYPGRVIASHSNAVALLKGSDSNRHLTGEVIDGLVERGGVIGVVPCNSFLLAGWQREDSRQLVTLQHVVAQIDHICQRAGSAAHVGLGTDFDGGFGLQSVPAEIDTIADLQKLVPLLIDKGYSAQDVSAILGGNWLHLLQTILPEDQ